MLRSAKRCAADPGPIVHSASAWVPALRCIVQNAALHPGHETHCFTLSQNEVLNPHGEERGKAARLEPRGHCIRDPVHLEFALIRRQRAADVAALVAGFSLAAPQWPHPGLDDGHNAGGALMRTYERARLKEQIRRAA